MPLRRRIVPLLMAALLSLLFASTAANASGQGELGVPQAQLTVKLERGDTPLPGARFSVHRVGELAESGAITLIAPFAGNFDVSDVYDQRGWARAANAMAEFVANRGLAPAMSGVTAEDGCVSFEEVDGLSRGVYLVVGDDVAYGDTVYSSLPFLISVPGVDPVTGEWCYELLAMPKPGERPGPTPAPTPSPSGGGKVPPGGSVPSGPTPKTGDNPVVWPYALGIALIAVALGYRLRRRT